MATYEIFASINLSPGDFFPVGIDIVPIEIEGNGKDYPFTIGGEARFVRVYWNAQSLIQDVELYGADNVRLAKISGISMHIGEFEESWLETVETSAQMLAILLPSDDEWVGNDAENTFQPGLGNDMVFGGGDNSVNDIDYVDYSADDRQQGITVDLDDGDADRRSSER